MEYVETVDLKGAGNQMKRNGNDHKRTKNIIKSFKCRLTCRGSQVQVLYRPPKSRNNLDIAGCKSTVPRCCGFFIFKISEVQKKMPGGNFLNPMDLNSEFRVFGTSDSTGRPFSSQKGRSRTEKLYTKNRAPVCWYQRINRPGFFVFRRK